MLPGATFADSGLANPDGSVSFPVGQEVLDRLAALQATHGLGVDDAIQLHLSGPVQ